MSDRTRKLTTLAMLSAVALLMVFIFRIPVVLFLKYEPKDVIITIGGFIYGPLASMLISVVVSLIEMVTVSDNGPIGLLMNVLATCSFACTAAFIYKKKPTVRGAVIGLVAGTIMLTAVMLLWNYFITPFYLGVPREDVVGMLLPAFLPFNLLKGALNSALILLLYKPLVTGLRKTHLIPESQTPTKNKANLGVILVSAVILASGILFVLVLNGII